MDVQAKTQTALLLLLCCVGVARPQCSFPSQLSGKNMTSIASGALTFNDTSVNLEEGLRGCTAGVNCPAAPLVLHCHQAVAQDTYWLRSDDLDGLYFHICWYLEPVTDDKVVYYQGPERLNTFYNGYITARTTSYQLQASEVCNLPTPLPARRHSLMLNSDTLTSLSSGCPDAMLGSFTATFGDVTPSLSSCNASFDVCSSTSRQTILINDTGCSPTPFSAADGKIDCLHSLSQNGTTYVSLFTPENATVTFTCLAFIEDGTSLYVTQADVCQDVQVPTVSSFYANLSYTAVTDLCPFNCVLPTELSGNWVSSLKGALTLTPESVQGLFTCTSSVCSTDIDTLQCYRKHNDQYLLRSPVTTINGYSRRVYVCLQLNRLSPTKFLYYQLHIAKEPTLDDYVSTFNSGQSVSVPQACDDMTVSPYSATRHSLLIKAGFVGSSAIACPVDLLAEFNSTNGACATTFSTCTNNTEIVATSSAGCSPKPFFSDSGSVGCAYTMQESATTYITVYSQDPATDGTNTFPFTCVALSLTGTVLKLSQNPLGCVDSQTSTAITSDKGALFSYDRKGDCPVSQPAEEDDSLVVILVVVILLLVLLLIAVIILCVVCRKKRAKRRRKEEEERNAILDKEKEKEMDEEEKYGSNLSVDSGYPNSTMSPDGAPFTESGRASGRRSGHTPRSDFALVCELPGEEGGSGGEEVVLPRIKSPHRPGSPRGPGGEQADGISQRDEQDAERGGYETDGEGGYSEDSWEEYVDDEGVTQLRPVRKHRRRRPRRRKKVKHTYMKTVIMEDGTTRQEEVESEYSVTASSDRSSGEEDRDSIGHHLREARERRKQQVEKIRDAPVDPADTTAVIVTRDMDERTHQPEKKRRSLWTRMKRRAREMKRKKAATKGPKRGLFEGEARAEVPGVTDQHLEIPYLLKYQNKKTIERALNDEGFFDDPSEKIRAETVFGFQDAERELSPKPEVVHTGDQDEERMVSATESSQSDGALSSRDRVDTATSDEDRPEHESDSGDAASEAGQSKVDLHAAAKGGKKEKDRHVTIDHPFSPSPSPSSDSEFRIERNADRKSSDTSSGVADLSPGQQSSSPEPDVRRPSRRVSLGWEKLQGLYSRNRIQSLRDEANASRQSHGGRKGKQGKDKRVKTALRRLLNERLFAGNDKKKSRRDDDAADSWTNADSLGNNVSVNSSAIGVRPTTRHAPRPGTQGKVNFTDEESAHGDHHKDGARGRQNDVSPNRKVKLAFGAGQINDLDPDPGPENDENVNQERLPTRGGSKLPPLRTPHLPLSRVFTPANYPKWGICVTASQRSMLVDGLERDKTFLSRQRAQTAWGSKPDDGMILPPSRHRENGEVETTDDESLHDPHRPDTSSQHSNESQERQPWAHRRAGGPGGQNSQSISYTSSSGRSPLDLDDRRLRRLLEELYKDKKFMDKMITKIDEEHLEFPDTIAAEDVKFLSEFGRQYLLERATYWELRGPLGPPRPPPTALGLRLSRAQTSLASDSVGQSSDQSLESPRPKTVR